MSERVGQLTRLNYHLGEALRYATILENRLAFGAPEGGYEALLATALDKIVDSKAKLDSKETT